MEIHILTLEPLRFWPYNLAAMLSKMRTFVWRYKDLSYFCHIWFLQNHLSGKLLHQYTLYEFLIIQFKHFNEFRIYIIDGFFQHPALFLSETVLIFWEVNSIQFNREKWEWVKLPLPKLKGNFLMIFWIRIFQFYKFI